MSLSSYQKITRMLGSAWPIVHLKSPASDEMAVIENICRLVQPRFENYGLRVYVYDVALGLRQAFVGADGLSLLDRWEIEDATQRDDIPAVERAIFTKALNHMPEDKVLNAFGTNPITEPLNWLYQTAQDDTGAGIYLFLDFHEYLTPGSPNYNAGALRFVKSLAAKLKCSHRRMVFLSHDWDIPSELEGLVYGVENDIPTLEQLHSLFEGFVSDTRQAAQAAKREFKNTLSQEQVDDLCREAQLLTTEEFLNALRLDVYGSATLNPGSGLSIGKSTLEAISDLKAEKLTKCGIKLAPAADVQPAGIEHWQDWVEEAKDLYYLDEANNIFNLQPPSGALLLGVPGSGKSLAAKSLASQWGLKVAQFNMGDMMNSLVGESERRLREALEAFNHVGRIVVFMDEIEKALGSGDLDGGTSTRMIGALLTWLQEKPAGVFVVATANDLTPILNKFPELLRSGRFDEIFWFDLPGVKGRAEILQVHLKARGVEYSLEDLMSIADNSVFDEFVGADLEQCVLNAAKLAFKARVTTITDEHLLSAAAAINPMARRIQDRLDAQRRWASDNARPAAKAEVSTKKTASKKVAAMI